jgi:hypothetical protein
MDSLVNRVVKQFEAYSNNPYLRNGQKWFLALHDVNPSLAKMITGHKNYDPFYKDSNLSDFMSWLTKTSNNSL